MRNHIALVAAAALSLLVPSGSADAQSSAARAYCAQAGHAQDAPVPPALHKLVGRSLGVSDAASLREAVFVRCVGPRLLGCYVGANLACGKANVSRANEGAVAFCKDSPNADVVPMSDTGHDTIYDWSCKSGRAVAGKALMKVDAQGYIAENWQDIR